MLFSTIELVGRNEAGEESWTVCVRGSTGGSGPSFRGVVDDGGSARKQAKRVDTWLLLLQKTCVDSVDLGVTYRNAALKFRKPSSFAQFFCVCGSLAGDAGS